MMIWESLIIVSIFLVFFFTRNENKKREEQEKLKENDDSQIGIVKKGIVKKFIDELKKVLTIGDNFMRWNRKGVRDKRNCNLISLEEYSLPSIIPHKSKSPHVVNQTKFCYVTRSPKPLIRKLYETPTTHFHLLPYFVFSCDWE